VIRCRPGALALALGLVACTGGPSDGPDADGDTSSTSSWWRRLGNGPAEFEELMLSGRDGWIAMHRNDHRAAFGAFGGQGVPAVRAALEEALLHDDLAHLVGHANRARYAALAERGTELGDLGDLFTSWGARCAPGGGPRPELVEPTASWSHGLSRGATCAGPFGAACGPLPGMAADAPEPLRSRNALHLSASGGDAAAREALYAAATEPVLSETADGFERRHMDPCLDATLAVAWSMQARAIDRDAPTVSAWVTELQGAGLAGDLFAPWPRAEALTVRDDGALWGAASGALWVAPGGVDLSHDQDPQRLRDQITAWRAWTDEEAASAVASAADPALLHGLTPVAGLRQDVLVAAGRDALRHDAPQQALLLLEAAVDVTDRDVGAANSPALYALLAEARLKTGRTRQALDALEPLTARVPTVASAKELVGDLAVLESMDRVGDSKEN